MSVILSDEVEAARRGLFHICETKEALTTWIQAYLGIHLPDCTVSDESNCNPMDLVWLCYDRMRRNDLEGFQRVLAYASRGGIKTLGASILEMLQVLHLERPTVHMAAIIDQSLVSAEYFKDFTQREWIRDFKVGDSKKRTDFIRYYNKITGQTLTTAEWATLTDAEQKKFRRIRTYVKLVPCTMTGANSSHTLNMTVDEVDVVPTQHMRAYRQAKHIPEPRKNKLPFTLLTSTRKSSVGLVQKEIDDSPKTGLTVLHWNVIDVTEACPPSRHKPEGPVTTRYINDQTFEHIPEDQFLALDEPEQKKFYARAAYEGCVTCPLFAACKGRLATEQKSTSDMLKPLASIIEKFRSTDPEEAQTELMCRKADASGLVFPRFSRAKHGRTAQELAMLVTGDPMPEDYTFEDLKKLMFSRDAKFGVGIDYGFTHPFAWVLVAQWGRYMLVLDCDERSGLELDDKIRICEPLKLYNPWIYADPEDPASTKTFKRKGFRMKDWQKFPGSVKFSIDIVRMKLQPAVGETTLYFCSDNPRVDYLMGRMEKYPLVMDVSGLPTDEPNDNGFDLPVALRYVVMNTYAPNGKLIGSEIGQPLTPEEASVQALIDQVRSGKPDDTMAEYLRVKLSGAPEAAQPPKTVQKQGFVFDG